MDITHYAPPPPPTEPTTKALCQPPPLPHPHPHTPYPLPIPPRTTQPPLQTLLKSTKGVLPLQCLQLAGRATY